MNKDKNINLFQTIQIKNLKNCWYKILDTDLKKTRLKLKKKVFGVYFQFPYN